MFNKIADYNFSHLDETSILFFCEKNQMNVYSNLVGHVCVFGTDEMLTKAVDIVINSNYPCYERGLNGEIPKINE
jgi:hypothetical protein